MFFLCSSSNRRGVYISDYYIPIVAFVEKKNERKERIESLLELILTCFTMILACYDLLLTVHIDLYMHSEFRRLDSMMMI